MQITDTTTLTRPNTNIEFELSTPDSNDPIFQKTNFTQTVTMSDDKLTRTIVRVWTDRELYLSDRSYVNVISSNEWYRGLVNNNFKYNRTIEIAE